MDNVIKGQLFSLVLMVVQRFDNNNAPKKTGNLGMENTTSGFRDLKKVILCYCSTKHDRKLELAKKLP